ncbi:hypothetical protein SODALDRAFT_298398 [Sodiomyces alkalinus F11]|uniref:RED-like N-terminal domain-containing protein n=1 Tax=Sodiomyces alkalinus (strain CBS 110278 / VKM F-3762 / F11) TaxID=1314773 RepID=A0A3N2PQP9_SODAK|nr:hypothetical protein SODALDRAFT_298398 [Sodiomyces alkalinus F11]ROT36805.1 hypothetical protein SODALDRAFT_298398 [Sodiomyces alkalinus F11]
MNNEQFRRLLGVDSPKPSQGTTSKTSPSFGSGSATPGALGSRQRASIPMTPRSIGTGQSDFLRQLAARDRATRQQKQFKTSAPKGSRLAQGYVDRAKEREKEAEDERARRVQALEELLKAGDIDRETFDKQVDEIAGGDLSSTHLVKGLDRKLLERIRKGEDVFGNGSSSSSTGDNKDGEPEPEPEEEEPPPDVDEELDLVAQRDVQAVTKEKTEKKKKGQLALAALAPGKQRTRDQIIAQMKAAREAAKAAKESGLGDKFRKIGAKQKAGTRIERDGKGREVLIIVDEDGHEKRMVRKVRTQAQGEEGDDTERRREVMMPRNKAKPLGMEVPEFYRKQQEAAAAAAAGEEDKEDIFSDAGDDYDPLAGVDSDSDSDSDDEEKEKAEKAKEASTKDKTGKGEHEGEGEAEDTSKEGMLPPPKPSTTKDYFKGSRTELLSAHKRDAPSLSDPAIQAAFKKAAQLSAAREKRKATEDEGEDEIDEEEARKRAERRRKMLESARRDDEDLDLGFGTSRLEDEEDFDESKVKLSEWGQDDDDDEGGGTKGGKTKRKRGPKRRKGDVNNAEDVLRVMEQRKRSS